METQFKNGFPLVWQENVHIEKIMCCAKPEISPPQHATYPNMTLQNVHMVVTCKVNNASGIQFSSIVATNQRLDQG